MAQGIVEPLSDATATEQPDFLSRYKSMREKAATLVGRIAKWLENFTPAKCETAMLFVDGLQLVSSTDLRRELGDLIADLAARLPGPVAAFPAREVAKGKSTRTEGRSLSVSGAAKIVENQIGAAFIKVPG